MGRQVAIDIKNPRKTSFVRVKLTSLVVPVEAIIIRSALLLWMRRIHAAFWCAVFWRAVSWRAVSWCIVFWCFVFWCIVASAASRRCNQRLSIALSPFGNHRAKANAPGCHDNQIESVFLRLTEAASMRGRIEC